MNTIVINENSYSVEGGNISIFNNRVMVNGKTVESGLSGIVEIRFEGDLATLGSSASVTVNGNVQGNAEVSGSVSCNNVGGNVEAGGSVSCGKVSGSVKAGGSIMVN